MDGIIAITIILTVFFIGVSLRAVYVFLTKRRELKTTVADTLYVFDGFQKKESRRGKLLAKMLHFADDFQTLDSALTSLAKMGM